MIEICMAVINLDHVAEINLNLNLNLNTSLVTQADHTSSTLPSPYSELFATGSNYDIGDRHIPDVIVRESVQTLQNN